MMVAMNVHLGRRSALRLTAAGLSATLAAACARAVDKPPMAVVLFDPRDSKGKPAPVRPELDRSRGRPRGSSRAPSRAWISIFAPDPGQSGSRRSLETVTPLAAALNLAVDARFAPTQTAPVADAIRASSGSVLVAWKHEQIVDIITALGTVSPTPPQWPGSRFDLVYVLTRDGDGWRFSQFPQMLLAGDRLA